MMDDQNGQAAVPAVEEKEESVATPAPEEPAKENDEEVKA